MQILMAFCFGLEAFILKHGCSSKRFGNQVQNDKNKDTNA